MTDLIKHEDHFEDKNGNKSYFSYFGGEDEAKKAILSLENCSGCSDCRDCSGCIDCRDCSGCSYCSDCRDCSYCSDCRDFIDCIDCSDCRDCRGCSGCRDCRDCSYCSGLKNVEKKSEDNKKEIWKTSVPDLNKKVYEATKDSACFDMSNWHTCDTVHCWAGWIVTLAGEEGGKLEKQTSTDFAAMQIYKNSNNGERISPVNFFLDDEEALVKIKELANLTKVQEK